MLRAARVLPASLHLLYLPACFSLLILPHNERQEPPHTQRADRYA